MMRFLDRLPYTILIMGAILMLLAPMVPMPHIMEKFIMLKNGALHRPIDIFDVFFHLAPTILLVAKVMRDRMGRS